MKSFRVIALSSLAVPLVLAACGKSESERQAQSPNTATYEPSAEPMSPASRVNEQQGQPAAPPTAESTIPPAPAAQALRDDQIVAIADASNGAEVEQAKLALSRSKNARVKEFAQLMIDHHGKAKQDVMKIGLAPSASPQLVELQADAAEGTQTLKAASADMFDKVYIDLQVAEHKKVLDQLDRELIPAAQNPDLKRSLTEFRPKIEAHLREAEKIQEMLANPSPNKGVMKHKPELGGSTNPGSPTNPGNPNNPLHPGGSNKPGGAK